MPPAPGLGCRVAPAREDGVTPVTGFNRDELAELGEAYRDKLDAELLPTRIGKEIDWAMLLSTSEMRRRLVHRFRRLGALDRAAVLVVAADALLVLVWLAGLGVRAIS